MAAAKVVFLIALTVPSVFAFVAGPPPKLRPKSIVTRQAAVGISSSSIWLAETGAASTDPVMISLALGSFGLLVFITVGTIYLTASDSLEKQNIENPKVKPKLPTMSELEAKGGSTLTADTSKEGPNRQARRIERRSKGKKNVSDRITF